MCQIGRNLNPQIFRSLQQFRPQNFASWTKISLFLQKIGHSILFWLFLRKICEATNIFAFASKILCYKYFCCFCKKLVSWQRFLILPPLSSIGWQSRYWIFYPICNIKIQRKKSPRCTVFTFLLILVVQAIHSNIWSMKLKCVTSKQSVVTSYLDWKLVALEMAIAYLS